tara:strand:+ start:51995 stop:54421 length:2427 start_codon:yes stop_codon:yes gene_type:complete
MSTDSNTLAYFPPQKLPFSEKDEQWIENCVDGVISVCYAYGLTRRSSTQNKLRNYKIFNNKIDKGDIDRTLHPYGVKGGPDQNTFPASLQPYDILSQYFHLLIGEESKRIFNPIVIAINDDAVSEKQSMKQKEIMQVLEQLLVDETQDPESPEIQKLLQKYKNYTPKMMIEQVATYLLNYNYRNQNLDITFNDCFKDVLLAGEEIVSVDKVGDGVKVRRVNPVETFFQINNNSNYLDDAEKIYERNFMTVSEIVDEFYEYLTADQIDWLESYGQGANGIFGYGDVPLVIPEVESLFTFDNANTLRGIPVHRVKWKSKKKQGIWRFPDPETGELQETIVEESFKAPKGTKVKWFWINEYWQSVRIGQDIYLHKLSGPCKQQFRKMSNLSECKSGYIGTIYSATNAQGVSLMDRLVPWYYLYLVIWYRTELAIAKNLGNLGVLDTSLMPDGWEIEKWLYYAQAMGIVFVNSFGEAAKKAGLGANPSQQMRSLPLETGNYIQGHIQLLQFIEDRIQNTSGITRQRLGNIATSELVGNTERATVQSSHITEPYFFPHEFFKKRVCEAVIEVSKECVIGKTSNFQYITDDIAQVLFEVDGDKYANTDYGVFVSNSSKDEKSLDLYKGLLQSALQADKVDLSSVVKTLNSMSISEIEGKLLEGEEEKQRQMMEMQKQQEQAQMQQTQAIQEMEKEKLDREDMNKQLDRENQIQIAEIKALGNDAMSTEGPDTSIITDAAKIALEQSKLAHQKLMEEAKLNLERKKIDAENQRTQMEKDHYVKQQRHEKDMQTKDAIHKEKLERIKARNKPKPKK